MTSARRSLRRRLGKLRERRDPPAPTLSLPPGPARDDPPAPIFVIGCHRSGTSLLRRIIDSHPRIACPPESKFLAPLTELLRDEVAMRGLSSMGYERAAVVGELRRLASTFFEEYARSVGKARWADKTPNYVDLLPELWELFGPEARYVLLIRDGMDVAYSLSNPRRRYPVLDPYARRTGGDLPVAAGLFWREKNDEMERFRGQHPEACHLLRYEDLTSDPAAVLVPMFGFLGEPWEARVLEFGRFPHHAGFEDPDVRKRPARIEPNSGTSSAWPPEVREAVRRACEPTLSALGYGQSDRTP